MTTITQEMQQEVGMSPEMQMYMNERGEQRKALIRLADRVAQGIAGKGLSLDIEIARGKQLLADLEKENLDAANEEYEKLSKESDGQPFVKEGFKFLKNSGTKSYVFIGETGQKIKDLDKQAKHFNDQKKLLQEGAKKSGVDVRVSVKPQDKKFKLQQLAPKSKPAA